MVTYGKNKFSVLRKFNKYMMSDSEEIRDAIKREIEREAVRKFQDEMRQALKENGMIKISLYREIFDAQETDCGFDLGFFIEFYAEIIE